MPEQPQSDRWFMAGGFIEPRVEEYLYGVLPPRDPVLSEMEALAKEQRIPIVGPAVGRLLYLLTKISGARRIFEMGSAIGYSTIWFARAAGAGAKIIYTDGDPANQARASEYFRRAGVAPRIRTLVGNAIELIDTVPGKFDLVFIDVDKHQYPEALQKAVPRLARRGLLVTDNTLWSGKVAGPENDANTLGVKKFNEMTYSSPELFPVILPLRDGVTVCRKE